ncbi:hypothetical protein TVAG_273290 [Trichomonas vaginalis G3]|uniref:Uncharacterized protein n=1 Tax=Trichomonas vaginalis (strain ATCC PRA-98 / G3) TaxID=412133 RepID=A2EZV5_TRIV3|nr:guanylate cyclase protein [Trichomonas vaginalis G3]EAY01818.1 hypothetical protein TVAG_273290 [Trichomonas vaginalis G3]KAI5550381.1 guanylate cyclase protein [Trichomonas vaginalis G3]|eukprot:XP_001314365.1 hypothetical protein [Trichomonas vaginalis G3]
MNANNRESSQDSVNNEIQMAKSNGYVEEQFPLFASLFQQKQVPPIVFFPFMGFFFLQVLFVALWPWSEYWDRHQEHSIVPWIRTILFFIPQPSKPLYYIIISSILFGLTAFTFFCKLFAIEYYKYKRKFITFFNQEISIYNHTILFASFVPSIVGTGETFLKIARGNYSAYYIVSFIFYALTLTYESYSFALTQKLASKSLKINVTMLFNFDPTVMVITLYAMLVTILLYFLLNLFEAWSEIFIYVICILIFGYQTYYMLMNLPFFDMVTQSLAVGWFVGCVTANFISILCYFFPNMKYSVPLLLTLITYIFFSGVALVFFIFKINYIKNEMNQEFKYDEQAFEYYDIIGLNFSRSSALVHLKIAFQYNCVCFTSLSLVNYLIERYDEDELVLSMCLQLLSFFPKETRLQKHIQKLLLKRRRLSFTTRFLIYQLESLNAIRNFSINQQSKIKLIELKTMSRQVEMMTKAALDNNKLTANYFETLSEKAIRAKAIWKENIQNMPNNSKLLEEYIRYLVEAECDFTEAVYMKHRQSVIELGNSFSVDYSFRSMVAAFPNYLKKKVVDFNGRICTKIKEERLSLDKNNSFLQQSNASFNEKASDYSNSDYSKEELDAETEEFFGKQTILLSKVRLALHRTLLNKIPLSIKSIYFVSFIMTLYILLVFILGNTLSVIQIENQVDSMQQLKSLSLTRFYSALANIDIIMEFTREIGQIQQYTAKLKEFLSDDDRPFIIPFDSMLGEIINYTTLSSQNLHDLMELLAERSIKGDDVYDYASSLTNETLPMYVCFAGGYNYYPASLASIASQMLANQRLIGGRQSIIDAFSDAGTCEITTNFVP